MDTITHANASAEENTDFQILPDKFRKNGYDFELVVRNGDAAIFKQLDEGNFIAYEVFEIRKQKASEFNGIKYEAKERVPSNEEWGNNAYTVHNLERAYERMTDIQNAILNRQNLNK